MSETENAPHGVADAGAEPVATELLAPETEVSAPEADKPEHPKEDKAERRIARLTARLAATSNENAAMAARLEALERVAPKPATQEPITASRDEIERMISERADHLATQRATQARVAAWDAAGSKEFGADQFLEHCNTVAEVATPAQRASLLQVITDMDDGHKAVAELAADPDEAARIVALPPHRMALALAKLIAEPAPPRVTFSKAPAPIKPVSGTAKAAFNERTATGQELVEYYSKQAMNRR